MKRFVTETDDTGKSTTVTLPEYVNRICADNTAQAEQLVEYRDFMRDMCHALGMSLESTFADVLRRVEKLKVASPSVPSERALTGEESPLSVEECKALLGLVEGWQAKHEAILNENTRLKGVAISRENETLWTRDSVQHLLEEYRTDNAALNRQVEEYRSVAFGLWESLEKARSSEPPVVVSVPSGGLFPGNWVEVR